LSKEKMDENFLEVNILEKSLILKIIALRDLIEIFRKKSSQKKTFLFKKNMKKNFN